MPVFLRERLSGIWGTLGFAVDAGSFVLRHSLSGPHKAQDRGFAEFWTTYEKQFLAYESTTAIPSLVAAAHGTVLELGPAQGNQLPRFDHTRVTHVYGIEPNAHFLPGLHASISRTGLADRYTPILGSITDTPLLDAHDLGPASIDCVLSIQVLCSVSDPAAVAAQLYNLLKPGGSLILWEHQASRDSLTSWTQWALNFLWTPAVGGCRLDNHVEAAVCNAGPWAVVELQHGDDQPWSLKPRIWGRLVK